MFMGQALRSPANPLCISAHTLRARARAARSAGHSCFSGKRSDRYSAMASESQTISPSSSRSGTLPVGLTASMVCLNSDPGAKLSKRTMTSSKAMPVPRISTQGRMDQEE